MVKKLIAPVILSLMLLGCAETPLKDEPALEESTETATPQELMYQQRQKIQQQMMQQGQPSRIGPGRR